MLCLQIERRSISRHHVSVYLRWKICFSKIWLRWLIWDDPVCMKYVCSTYMYAVCMKYRVAPPEKFKPRCQKWLQCTSSLSDLRIYPSSSISCWWSNQQLHSLDRCRLSGLSSIEQTFYGPIWTGADNPLDGEDISSGVPHG